jgi:hypothetical protein
VVLKLDYTAREGGDLLRDAARASLQGSMALPAGEDGALAPPLRRMFSARHEFPAAWHTFLHPSGPVHRLALPLQQEHYPYTLRGLPIHISTVDVYVWGKDLPSDVPLAITQPDGSPIVTATPLIIKPAAPGMQYRSRAPRPRTSTPTRLPVSGRSRFRAARYPAPRRPTCWWC